MLVVSPFYSVIWIINLVVGKEFMKKKYDIFISYRRIDSEGKTSGRDIARTIKLELEKRGFNVFFDYSEIKDSVFESIIIPAVRQSKYFILVLSKDALVRCANSGDWVRREINEAIVSGCKIIPISPDGQFSGWPSSLPNELQDICMIHVSEVALGSLFEKSIDKLIEERFKSKHHLGKWITVLILSVIVLLGCLLLNNVSKLNSNSTNIVVGQESPVQIDSRGKTNSRDICNIIETFVKACEENKPASNCFWSVFYKIDSMSPLTSETVSTDHSWILESMFSTKLEYRVKLTFRDEPFSVTDIGSADICTVTLYGAHAGASLLYISHNYGARDSKRMEQVASDMRFKLKKRIDEGLYGEFFLYQRDDMYMLLSCSCGSGGTFGSYIITEDIDDITEYFTAGH